MCHLHSRHPNIEAHDMYFRAEKYLANDQKYQQGHCEASLPHKTIATDRPRIWHRKSVTFCSALSTAASAFVLAVRLLVLLCLRGRKLYALSSALDRCIQLSSFLLACNCSSEVVRQYLRFPGLTSRHFWRRWSVFEERTSCPLSNLSCLH